MPSEVFLSLIVIPAPGGNPWQNGQKTGFPPGAGITKKRAGITSRGCFMQKHSQQFHNIFVHISSFSYGSYNKVLSRISFIYSRVRILTEGLST